VEIRLHGVDDRHLIHRSIYPQNLLHTVETIESNYVRPVSRVDLLFAALSGLYELSGESPPESLRADVDRAVRAKDVQRLIDSTFKRPNLPAEQPDDSAVLRLIERTRKLPEIAKRVNDEEALLTSSRAMVRILDPYCEVLIGDEARRSAGNMDNFGTGIDLDENDSTGAVRIKEVLPGSPAQKAGLRPGDRIVAVDGKAVGRKNALDVTLQINRGITTGATYDIFMVEARLDGVPIRPSTLRLTVERTAWTKAREISLERSEFKAETVFGIQRHDDNTWDYWIDRERRVAHVRIGTIRDGTDSELREIVQRLEKAGMRALLLDLRWCPGGLLTPANNAAGLFVDSDGIVAFTKWRRNQKDFVQQHVAETHGLFTKVLMMVLVGPETSGGGELIAAALQESGRGKIAGQRTRGKASVQVMHPLPARGAFLKLTNAVFVTPNRKNLHRFPDSKPRDDWGVRPEDGLEFRVSPAMNRQVREWWVAQTLRPGSSCERLPLDDPENDPQRQLALQALRERLK
jgi:carboxyl-terminal processing protease